MSTVHDVSSSCFEDMFTTRLFVMGVATKERVNSVVLFWGSNFNDGTTQTARDPLLKGSRFAP